ncbi:hypothetical protein [Nitrococcus mobilis]|uniref:Arginine/ornithine antiporter ArcD n=1 Tax=Nitrococcus mobilis Nb-231 TaxID=314278 RepID=A4BTC2_9GAMM|nr:hypothetical protein [Nitrococcus mobilis]EAR21024.1 hypothetical protein NB231_07637 [Nitrococcus mobilis Nb-231]
MDELWPWIAMLGLGAFHGINPAMGWLFAVALGLHRGQRQVVLLSLIPLALGHALAIGVTLVLVALVGRMLDPGILGGGAGALLIGWGLYHAVRGHRYRLRVGMQTGMVGLLLWSFVMATAHGAGLMLLPVFFAWLDSQHGHLSAASPPALLLAVAGVAVHTLAMFTVAGMSAVAAYEWVGLAVLRHGWVNLDWLWSAALVGVGVILLVIF